MLTPPERCLACGGPQFELGFIDDVANGRVRWIEGKIELDVFGNAKRGGGRAKRFVLAARCTECSRLELYATAEV